MAAADRPTYSIVTTCKGRLEDLKRSLPRFVCQHDTEVIVVDYDCPQGAAAYVERTFPTVRTVRVPDRPLFSGSDARNRGAAEAAGSVLAFLDADVVVAEDFLDHAQFPARELAFAVFPAGKGDSLRGSCLVRRGDFETVGRYDDLLAGYEGEDLDLYRRLRMLGARRIELAESGVDAVIEQTLEERLAFRPPDLVRQFLRGQLYQSAKETVMRLQGIAAVDAKMRKTIMAEVDRQLETTFAGEKDFELTFNLPDRHRRGLLDQWEFSTAVTVRASKKDGT